MRLILAAAVLAALPVAACAQTPPAAGGAEMPAVGGQETPVAGGWSAAEVTPEIEEIAVWAFNQLDIPGAELAEIENVQQQVVAGMNYRMDLVFMDGRRFRVTVYRRFDGERRLTNSDEIGPSGN